MTSCKRQIDKRQHLYMKSLYVHAHVLYVFTSMYLFILMPICAYTLKNKKITATTNLS